MPTGQEQQLFDGRTVENKGKLIITSNWCLKYDFEMHFNIWNVPLHREVCLFIELFEFKYFE